MGVDISITGLKELQDKLDALPTKLAKKVLRPALENAGSVIQKVAERRAPHESGFLEAHIRYEVVFPDAQSAFVKVGPTKSAYWALFSELGTAPHTETSKDGKIWNHPGEPPKLHQGPFGAESRFQDHNGPSQHLQKPIPNAGPRAVC